MALDTPAERQDNIHNGKKQNGSYSDFDWSILVVPIYITTEI